MTKKSPKGICQGSEEENYILGISSSFGVKGGENNPYSFYFRINHWV